MANSKKSLAMGTVYQSAIGDGGSSFVTIAEAEVETEDSLSHIDGGE